MGLFDWLRGGADNERDAPRHHPPPIPSKAGVAMIMRPDTEATTTAESGEASALRTRGNLAASAARPQRRPVARF